MSKPRTVIPLKLFDAVIDCLGGKIPDRWPFDVRMAIEGARNRILLSRPKRARKPK